MSGSDLLVAWIDFIFCGQNYCFISLGCLKFSKKRYTKYETLILLSNLLDRELVLCRKTLYSEIVSFQNLNATNFFQVLLNQRCQMALREDLWPYWVYSYRSQMPKRLAISVTRLIFINILLFGYAAHVSISSLINYYKLEIKFTILLSILISLPEHFEILSVYDFILF